MIAFPRVVTCNGGGTLLKSESSPGICIGSTRSSGAIPGIMGTTLVWSEVVTSSDSLAEAGIVFKLYLSLIESPGRLRVQNLQLCSFEPEHRIWPAGCQDNAQTRTEIESYNL